MTTVVEFSNFCFSQPYGPGQLYGRPPYPYRDARSITAVFTVEGTGIEEFLPPGVEVADPEPLALITASHYPQSAFGRYNEFWLYVRVTFKGERFMYCVAMYTDSEKATASGRELWGFPKKMAQMSLRQESGQWIFRAERPADHCMLTLSFIEEDDQESEMLAEVSLPTLSLRLIPHFTGEGEPDIAQLLATDNKKRLRQSSLGTDERRRGRAFVSWNSTIADPFGPFTPRKMLSAWFFNYDTDVPGAYRLVHDYKAKAEAGPSATAAGTDRMRTLA
jgi:Acetoacetate decarboxylase